MAEVRKVKSIKIQKDSKLKKADVQAAIKSVYENRTCQVTPSSKGGWDVMKGGGLRVTRHFDTKNDAVNFAREISQNQKADLVIHKKDGSIQRSARHGLIEE
jgi:hypothetical protein